jgi:hypothetical protein
MTNFDLGSSAKAKGYATHLRPHRRNEEREKGERKKERKKVGRKKERKKVGRKRRVQEVGYVEVRGNNTDSF